MNASGLKAMYVFYQKEINLYNACQTYSFQSDLSDSTFLSHTIRQSGGKLCCAEFSPQTEFLHLQDVLQIAKRGLNKI